MPHTLLVEVHAQRLLIIHKLPRIRNCIADARTLRCTTATSAWAAGLLRV